MGDLGKLNLTLTVDGQGNVTGALNDVTAAQGRMASEAEKSSGRMADSFKNMIGAFTIGNLLSQGIEKVFTMLDTLRQKIDESARYAARVETLGISMVVVGNNAGYTAVQMAVYETQVKKMGITTEAARQALTQTAAAQMDVAKTAQLARVAQDAGVIGNINSSEALQRMVQGIRSGELEVLKTIGINVSFEASYKKLADSLGIATTSLSEHQKVQARQNAVLEYGVNISGVYEAAMGTTGKQITSLSRYYDELKLSFGEAFAPALGVLVDATTSKLKSFLAWFGENRSAIAEFAENMASIVAAGVNAVAHPIDTLGKIIVAPFVGGEEDIATTNAQTAIDQKWREMEKKKAEDKRMKLMAAARAAQEKADAQRLADAAAAKEIDNDNRFIVAFNDKIRAIEQSDPTLTKHQQQLEKLNEEQEKMLEAYPKEAAEINKLYAWITEETKARQANAAAMAAEGHDDNADNWAKMYAAAAKSMQEFQQTLTATRALELETSLARIDAEERFYQLTAGQAAEKRLVLLKEELAINTDIYNAITEQTPVADLARAKALDDISKINTKLLEQKKILADSTFWGGMLAGMQEYSRNALDIGSQMKASMISAFKGMEDALVEFVRHGKLNFTDLVNSMLDDIARLAVRQNVMGPFSGLLTGLLGTGTAAASGYLPQIGEGTNSAGSLLDGTSAGGLSSLVSAVSLGAKTGTAAGASSGVASGMSAIAPYLGVAIGGYMLASDMFKSGGLWNQSTGGQRAMRAVAYSNPFTLPFALLDQFTGGGLFGTKWGTSGSGLSLGVGATGLDAMNYADQKKKKGWFGGNAYRTNYSGLDEQMLAYLYEQYAGIGSSIATGAGVVGGSGSLAGFTSANRKISLSGLDAEAQQKAITGYFRDISNEAIKSLYADIDSYAKMGEDASATFERLTASGRAVNDFFTGLGLTLNSISLAGAAASDALVQALGGLSSANSAFSAYMGSSLFTDSERTAASSAVARSQIAAAFSGLGRAAPTTAGEYKALVTQQLALGAAGAATAATLLKLAPAFATLQDAATAIYDERKSALTAEMELVRKSADLWRSAGQTLDQSLLAVASAGLSPEAQLASLRGQFAAAVGKFQGGDVTAAGQVSSLARDLQSASRDYYASGSGFASDSAALQDTLSSLSNFASSQAGSADIQVVGMQTQIDQMKSMNVSLNKIAASLDTIESKTSLADSAPLSAAA